MYYAEARGASVANPPIPTDLLQAVHQLVEANRLQCLWFMKEDYFPATAQEIDRALSEIELHGDCKAWTKARTLRACHSMARRRMRDAASLAEALVQGTLRFHRGSIRGSIPRFVDR